MGSMFDFKLAQTLTRFRKKFTALSHPWMYKGSIYLSSETLHKIVKHTKQNIKYRLNKAQCKLLCSGLCGI